MSATKYINSKSQMEIVCIEHGLTVKEYQVLTFCMDGHMTDAEIRCELFLTKDQFQRIVDALRAKSLVGRRKGLLIASIEGRSAFYEVLPLAA